MSELSTPRTGTAPTKVALESAVTAACTSPPRAPYAGIPSELATRSRRVEAGRAASPPPWADDRDSMRTARQTSPPSSARGDPDKVGMAFLAKGLTTDSAEASLQRHFAHGGAKKQVLPPAQTQMKPDTSLLTPQELGSREAPPEGKKIFTKAPAQNPILLGEEPPRERRGMPYSALRDDGTPAAGKASPRRRTQSPVRSPRGGARPQKEEISDSALRALSQEAPHRLSANIFGCLDQEGAPPPVSPVRDRSPQRSSSRARHQNLLSGHAMEALMRPDAPDSRLCGSPERPRQSFSKEEELTTMSRESRRRSTPQARTVHGLSQGLHGEITDEFKDQLGITRKGRASPKVDRMRTTAAPWEHAAAEIRRGKMSTSPRPQLRSADPSPARQAPWATDDQQAIEEGAMGYKARDRENIGSGARKGVSPYSPRLKDRSTPYGTELDMGRTSSTPQRLGIRSVMSDRETQSLAVMGHQAANALSLMDGLQASAAQVKHINSEAGEIAQAAVRKARADLEEAMGSALRCLSPRREGPALPQRSKSPLRRVLSPKPGADAAIRSPRPGMRAITASASPGDDAAARSPRETPAKQVPEAMVWSPRETPVKQAPEAAARMLVVPPFGTDSSQQAAVQDAPQGGVRRASPVRQPPPFGTDFPASPASQDADVDKNSAIRGLLRPWDNFPPLNTSSPTKGRKDISPTAPKALPGKGDGKNGRAASGSPIRPRLAINTLSPRFYANANAKPDAADQMPFKMPMPMRITKDSMPASSSKERVNEDPLQQAYTKQLSALQSEIGQLQARHQGLETRMKRLRSETKTITNKDPVTTVSNGVAGSSSSKVPPPNLASRSSPGKLRTSPDEAFWYRPG